MIEVRSIRSFNPDPNHQHTGQTNEQVTGVAKILVYFVVSHLLLKRILSMLDIMPCGVLFLFWVKCSGRRFVSAAAVVKAL